MTNRIRVLLTKTKHVLGMIYCNSRKNSHTAGKQILQEIVHSSKSTSKQEISYTGLWAIGCSRCMVGGADNEIC